MSFPCCSPSLPFSGGPRVSLNAVKAVLPKRAVLCFTDGGFRAEAQERHRSPPSDTCYPLRGLPSTHATLHLASMSGVLEEEAEAQKRSGGSRGLKNNGTGKRVERGVWTMMVKEHRSWVLGNRCKACGAAKLPRCLHLCSIFFFTVYLLKISFLLRCFLGFFVESIS